MTQIRLSYSTLNSLARCERQFTLRYVEGIRQTGAASVQRILGSWYHAMAACHNLRLGEKHDSLLWRPSTLEILDGLTVYLEPGYETMYVEEGDEAPAWPFKPSGILTLCREWYSFQPDDWQAAFEEKYKESLPDRVANMWRRYRLRWMHTDEARIPLLVEYEWSRLILKTPDSPVFQGRIDLLYFDPKRNLVVLSDLKTAASWPSDSERETAMWDTQLNMGLWGIKDYVKSAADTPLLKDRELNFAIEYDRGRTKKPSLPKLVSNRSKEGPAKVRSKAACDTDADTYTAWLKSEEAQEYGVELDEEYLAELEADTDRWFRRGLIPENPHATRIHMMAALKQSQRIPDLNIDNALPMPTIMGCGSCEYRECCSMTLMGVDLKDIHLPDVGLTHGVAPEDFEEEGSDAS